MKILALETSCEIASAALMIDGRLTSVRLASPPAHSATLLPAVNQLLADGGVPFSDLDAIAFGHGPGSFTGVRLACSVAQGLALGADLPVIPVCSLLALAEGCSALQVFCAMDARMNEAYVAAYRRVGDVWQEILAPACSAPDHVPVPEENGWFGAGTAFRAYPIIAERLAGRVEVGAPDAVPGAEAVARLALNMERVDPALVAPLYVRDRVALTVAERLAAGGKA